VNKAKHNLDDQDGAFAVLIRLDQALTPYSFSEAQNSKRSAARNTGVSRTKFTANASNHPPCPAGGHASSHGNDVERNNLRGERCDEGRALSQ
jgi:hypothetical protein